MIDTQFAKHYPTPGRAAAAVRNYRWIAQYAPPLRQPELRRTGPLSLTFEQVEGRPAGPHDLTRLAELLGNAHGTAWTKDLAFATLRIPHRFRDGAVFEDYLRPRQVTLRRRLEQGYLTSTEALHTTLTLLDKTAEGPCAFYKDSNLRNFIITAADELVTVDTDDLTLAPMGYDLAKLVATLLLTHGALSRDAIDEALAAYNGAARRHDAQLGTTDRERLDAFLALHATFTAPYIGRNGYRHSWPDVCPQETS
ncbi:hypothetical protein GCM10023224_16000 [Streptomonospora halophila]|uniref:Aminoglycoside phosphotransferase domain-containing protein n=1 Tax=Streptomonospora halophila TaxID=427369 RepID=A0ABP9GBB0_9ACTN